MPKTIWDKIYKEYLRSGQAWASLSDAVHPAFISFLKKADFKVKSALDLGCGNGKYLCLLQKPGFTISGIDSSPTAIGMARKKLGRTANLYAGDFYVTPIPKSRYDLIISVAAIHHARKNPINRLVKKIHKALLPSGRIFITFLRTDSLDKWEMFSYSKKIAPETYMPTSGQEKGLPHSFYDKEELCNLFSMFEDLKIIKDKKGRWIVMGTK